MDTLLVELRGRCLDESYSTAALLRMCLILGADTGSQLLAQWAERELKGYGVSDDLPEYRLVEFPLFADSVSGPTRSTGQLIAHYQIPTDLREHVPEAVELRHSVEELEAMAAASKADRLAHGNFPALVEEWSRRLGAFQAVTNLYYRPTTSAYKGLLGNIRTSLVLMVGDLTKDTPVELPSKQKVDTVVNVRIYGEGDHNELHVQDNSGIVGAGANSQQTQNNGLDVDALATLLDAVRDNLAEVDDDTRADVDQAMSDFESEIMASAPNEEAARSRGRALLRVCGQIGIAALTTAANAAVNGGLGMIGLG